MSGFQTAKQWAKVKFGIDLDVDLLISLSAADPQMHEVGIASPERLDGWRRTGVLLEPEPRDLEAIDALGVPVHLWCGRGDGYHSAMHASADALGGVFDSLSGDHMTAYGRPEGPAALRRFLDSVTPPSSTASRGSVTR